MIELRPFNGIGHANLGWLDAHHHFSFGHYNEPSRMGWGQLRVWNDDTIEPQTGFPLHSHSDMEIITYVRNGAITHKDNLGNVGRTVAGDVQVMSAGNGIEHSEFNLEDEKTQIFQIWIIPDERGDAPGWGARPFPKDGRSGTFVPLASGMLGDTDALPIRANARVLGATVNAGERVTYSIERHRRAYLVPATGRIVIEGVEVNARDGVAISDVDGISITAIEDSELVLVDVS